MNSSTLTVNKGEGSGAVFLQWTHVCPIQSDKVLKNLPVHKMVGRDIACINWGGDLFKEGRKKHYFLSQHVFNIKVQIAVTIWTLQREFPKRVHFVAATTWNPDII